MHRSNSSIRRRNEASSKKIHITSDDTEDVSDDKSLYLRTMILLKKLCGSYKLLATFTLAVFILQILVGISFFNTVSHRISPNSSPQEAPAKQEARKQFPNTKESHQTNNVTLPCSLTSKQSKEAVSAINRASSAQCKDDIANLVCSIHNGKVYPESLPRYCKSKVDPDRAGEHEGCFQDSFNQRLFQGDMIKFKPDNSPQKCQEHCLANGFIFAGVQYGLECFCGNSLPQDKNLSSEKCNMTCTGDSSLTCGGYLTMNIYSTGHIPLVPPKIGTVGEVTGSKVKIVYLLTIAGRASRQVHRLVKQIYSPHHYILVHVDSRQEFMFREVSKLSTKLPNLRVMKTRFSTIWGGASLLTMLLAAMKELLEMSDWTDWDFVLNLSESDYPVKTQKELVEFLTNNRESNFVKGHGREPDRFIKKQGLDKTFYECDTHMWRLGDRTLPSGVQIDGGSDWICLNRQFANYVVYSQDELVSGLKTLFKYTLLPAESFFHTVLRNSAFCQSYIDNNLHLTNWKRKQGCKCQYKHIVDWCGCSPNDFLPEDWAKIESSRNRQIFFARKFEPIVHQGIINKVQEWSTNVTIEETESKRSYWQNIYHSDDSKHDLDPTSLENFFSDTILKYSNGKLEYQTVKTLTVFSYDNLYNATLALIEVKKDNSEEVFDVEVIFRYIPKQKFSENYRNRINNAGVGTNFDPKELVFRNYVNLITQDSKLSVKVHFSTEEANAEEIQFGWFDPNKSLVQETKLKFNKTSLIEGVSPKLNTPLQPGIWSIVATKNREFLYSEKFLVVSSHKNQIAQNLPISSDTSDTFYNFLSEENEDDLVGENDGLVKHFFQVDGVCADTKAISSLPKCQETSWSTLFPDAKSEIIGVDPQTGNLI